MKQLIFLVAAILVFAACGAEKAGAEKADNLEWVLNLDEAKEMASKEGKVLLALCTGSDWCIWCKRLAGEVFTDPAFEKFAKENLILAKFDIMRNSNLSEEQQKYNETTVKKLNIKGFPTVILFNKDGKEITRTGYQQGGGAKYVEHLQELINKKQ